MRARLCLAWALLAVVARGGSPAAAQTLDRRQLERLERAVQEEGEAVLALADASGPSTPDFDLTWRNDFLKAQAGTFVPFVLGVSGPDVPAAALVYVRVAHRADAPRPGAVGDRPSGTGSTFPFEEIFPVELGPAVAEPRRVVRGFAVAPGDYDLTVVLRERGRPGSRGRRKAAVLRQPLTVPDFSVPGLATSTIILADGLRLLREAPATHELDGRPYVIGDREIEPALDATFRRDEELVVVFLVYNPALTENKQFDLEVEYHFFRKTGGSGGPQVHPPGAVRPAAHPGETYVNRTEPQRFNPLILGPHFDPASGQPVLAGQGVPLTGFQNGEYRLAIRVTDLVSGRSIERQVMFTVRS